MSKGNLVVELASDSDLVFYRKGSRRLHLAAAGGRGGGYQEAHRVCREAIETDVPLLFVVRPVYEVCELCLARNYRYLGQQAQFWVREASPEELVALGMV